MKWLSYREFNTLCGLVFLLITASVVTQALHVAHNTSSFSAACFMLNTITTILRYLSIVFLIVRVDNKLRTVDGEVTVFSGHRPRAISQLLKN